jgi:predicted N-acyltransferase
MSSVNKIVPYLNLENITFKKKRKLSENTDDNLSTDESRNVFKVKNNKYFDKNNSKLILNENKVKKIKSERALNNYINIDSVRYNKIYNNNFNESLSIKINKIERNKKHSSNRKDFYGNKINNRKKQKVTFIDEINPNKHLAKIIYVESYKKYNNEDDHDHDTDECCGSKCLIF